MTGRQRLTSIINKIPADGLSWTTIVDDATLALFPEELRGNGGIDFYKQIGCDIFLLNGWNTPYSFRSPQLQWPEYVKVETVHENSMTEYSWHTPKQTLSAVYKKGHPVTYPVTSLETVRIYREMWEGATFTGCDDTETFDTLNDLVGDSGVITRFWGPSTIPRLLEKDMGIETFYYMYHDHQQEMVELIDLMHEREMEAFTHLAAGPWGSVTLVENTSTLYISPDIYKKYNMPHQRDFVEAVKRNGKTAILHMCGHVHGILDLIRETGCDGIHALTQPPTGDCPWEDALDVLGDDLIIIGSLDPSIFVNGPIEDIGPALDRIITPRLRQGNFVLCSSADGITVDLERFLAVKQWMENNND